jgi:Ca-activated chloride channel family protein
MTRPLVLAALAAGLAVLRLEAQQPVFRGGTDIVMLNVTVSDTEQRMVGGLGRDDFQVFEDGTLQELSTFTREQQRIALSLLLDSSTSMERMLPVAQEAAIGFVRRLGPDDVAQIIDFDSQVSIAQTFTADRSLLERAIRQIQAGGSTSLYNAVYTAIDELKRVHIQSLNDIRRQAVVLLSDGEDTTSVIDYEQMLEQSKRSEAAVYAIGLRPKEGPAPRGFQAADYVLRTLAYESGGRAFFVDDSSQLAAIYLQIADELANQYTLGYTSRNTRRDGLWRTIFVKVRRANVVARTRSGYFAPGARR